MKEGLSESEDGDEDRKASGPVEKPLAYKIFGRGAGIRCLVVNRAKEDIPDRGIERTGH